MCKKGIVWCVLFCVIVCEAFLHARDLHRDSNAEKSLGTKDTNPIFTEKANIKQQKTQIEHTDSRNMQSSISALLGHRQIPQIVCEHDWQQKTCNGSIMCYATKCLYKETDIAFLHRIFLEKLILSLKERGYQNNQDYIAHLEQIKAFGMPKDTKKHDFVFIDSHKRECSYTLWQKDSKTLFFDMSGCLKKHNQRVQRTLLAHDSGVVELYEHIGY